jgi:hypothetical protein
LTSLFQSPKHFFKIFLLLQIGFRRNGSDFPILHSDPLHEFSHTLLGTFDAGQFFDSSGRFFRRRRRTFCEFLDDRNAMLVEFAFGMIRVDGRNEFDASLGVIRDLFSDGHDVNSGQRRDFRSEFSAGVQPKNLEPRHDSRVGIIVS